MARHLRVAPTQLGPLHVFAFDQLCPIERPWLITARTGDAPSPLD